MPPKAKVGRNDPCPCGSGKKHKKCCLRNAPVIQLGWPRLRRTEGELMPVLLKYAGKRYGSDVLLKAWEEYTLWDETLLVEPDIDSEFEMAFMPWCVFNWLPEDEADEVSTADAAMPIALEYLHVHGSQLTEIQYRFIEEICAQPYSFFVVTAVEPGQRMTLKDLLLDREITVHERQASTTLGKGAILYTRIMTLDEVSIMVGCTPVVIPPHYHLSLLDIRDKLMEQYTDIDASFLLDLDLEIRELYFDICDELHHPILPALQNTDGEVLQQTKLVYVLNCTPGEALDALASLSLGSIEELLSEASYDERGDMTSVEFPWLKRGNEKNKHWDNTVMGHLTITPGRLTIDVNSEQRAQAVKRKVTRRLGKRAVLKNTMIQSMEKMLEEMEKDSSFELSEKQRRKNEDLQALPEVQAQLRMMASQHWQSWLDTSIPALKNQTPRNAVKTLSGRERVEALLLQFESMGDAQPFQPDIADIRQQLGID